MTRPGPTVECILPARARTGESPTWSAHDGALYWIDIQAPALHRFGPNGVTRSWTLPAEVGCFALAADASHAVLGLRNGVHALELDSGALRLLAPPPFDPALFRFNEGACDTRGRFWMGTMFDPQDPAAKEPPRKGHLHSFTREGGTVTHHDVAAIPNGMAWDAEESTMFLAHSQDGTVFAFPFDRDLGRLGERRVFATVPESLGVPDGAAVDEDGCYWSAIHGGGRIRRFRPDGTVDRDLHLPVSCPTMCAFGGSDLAELFITTASEGVPNARRHELDGGLFHTVPGVRGQPTARLPAQAGA